MAGLETSLYWSLGQGVDFLASFSVLGLAANNKDIAYKDTNL